MNFSRKLVYIAVLFILIAKIDALKVIFYKKATTANPIDANSNEQKQKEEVNESNILFVPPNCKPGYVYEAKKCRRIAIWKTLLCIFVSKLPLVPLIWKRQTFWHLINLQILT